MGSPSAEEESEGVVDPCNLQDRIRLLGSPAKKGKWVV